MKTPKQVLQDWVSAYNACDPHALIELYHEDAENHQVAFGDPALSRWLLSLLQQPCCRKMTVT